MDNNNKPVKAPQGVPSKWGNLLYIIVPVLLVAVIASFMGTQNKKEAPKYFEIVEQFRSAQVTEFSLDLSSGSLEYKVVGLGKIYAFSAKIEGVRKYCIDKSDYALITSEIF